MKILVTGGLGYIGSHTAVALQEQGYKVLIVDNCSNAKEEVLGGIEAITGITPSFEKLDLRDKQSVGSLFEKHDLQGVIHFAASKAVGESVQDPLLYYVNNIASLVYVLKELRNLERPNFIFSSSCTVYGQTEVFPITEDSPVKPAESPYANTKQIGEEVIQDICRSNPSFSGISLRYFNPIGAHESTLIGELPIGIPQNLVPFITQTAAGIRKELQIFGNDYPTRDGTCIRDYIHVMDLAEAPVIALERLLHKKNDTNYEVFNLGTGIGNTVLEVVEGFEKASGQKLNYRFVPRRLGDVVAAYADTTRAQQILGWRAKRTLEDALASAWKWEQQLNRGEHQTHESKSI